MSEKRNPLFLERQGYRARRLTDMLRILPLIGALLWAVPLLWVSGEESPVTGSEAIIYLFGVWLLMVLSGAGLAALLERVGSNAAQEDG